MYRQIFGWTDGERQTDTQTDILWTNFIICLALTLNISLAESDRTQHPKWEFSEFSAPGSDRCFLDEGKCREAALCVHNGEHLSLNTLGVPLVCSAAKSADERSLPGWRSGSFSEWSVISNVGPVVNIFVHSPELIYLLWTQAKIIIIIVWTTLKSVSPFPERNDLLSRIWLKIMGNWKSGLFLWTISHPIKVNLKQINP